MNLIKQDDSIHSLILSYFYKLFQLIYVFMFSFILIYSNFIFISVISNTYKLKNYSYTYKLVYNLLTHYKIKICTLFDKIEYYCGYEINYRLIIVCLWIQWQFESKLLCTEVLINRKLITWSQYNFHFNVLYMFNN